ncbi:MAG TPA: ABC-2 family transporter protein [Patescibacteria group bacterium]|nr:ABC-2 family transporter protein [Patescibacteria group bacterium]
MQIALNLIFIKVIFGWVTSIKGWNYYEVLIIVGTAILVEGMIWMTCAYHHALKLILKTGSFDGLLVRPMDSQFLVSCYRGDLEDIVRVVIGGSIIIYGMGHLDVQGWNLMINCFLYVITLLCSYAILYSISVIVNSIAFWTIESPSTFAIFEVINRISEYPSDIFSGIVSRAIVSTIVPVLFIATVPARILSRGFDGRYVMGAIVIAISFIYMSRYVWKKGLAVYSSASS